VQGLAGDPQTAGRFAFIAAGGFQGGQDRLPLDLFQGAFGQRPLTPGGLKGIRVTGLR
jgi:hypothetical protein